MGRFCQPDLTSYAVCLLALLLNACGSDHVSPASQTDDDTGVRDRPDVSDTVPDTADAPAESTAECQRSIDCIDENPCTADSCHDGRCVHQPNDAAVPVQIPGNCRVERCEGGQLLLDPDDTDIPPDDGIDCTVATCSQGEVMTELDDASCDDHDRCNGTEVCDRHLGCQPGPPPDFDEDGIPDTVDETLLDTDHDGIPDCADWETCDGLDNDHDGLVDNDPQDEALGQPCYDGPAGTEDVGTCHAGILACYQGRLQCSQEVVPAAEELCDGRDDDCNGSIPDEEVAAHCRTDVVFTQDDPGPEPMRLEFLTKLRTVDVQFNIDTTGSMAGALNALRTTLRSDIVPGVAAVIPEVAFGVSTFQDYPLHNFGSGDDVPFQLWQRVTTDVSRVQDALSAITLGSGNDIDEAGIESLYQIATGAGTRWPRGGSSSVLDPSSKRGFVGEIDPAGDVDYFRVDIPEGTFLSIDVDASRVGSSLDPFIELYDATGRLLAASDDVDGLDPAMGVSTTGPPPYFLKVRGALTSSTGWYYVQVMVATTALAPAESNCSDLEVGGDFFAGAGDAIRLEGYEAVTPRSDPDGCFANCLDTLADDRATPWIRSHCFAGGTATCGDGHLDEYEECDDGNHDNGDGCSLTCSLETAGVPPFNAEVGFDPGLGNGTRGGVGFREHALPIIVHATDAESHDQEDYISRRRPSSSWRSWAPASSASRRTTPLAPPSPICSTRRAWPSPPAPTSRPAPSTARSHASAMPAKCAAARRTATRACARTGRARRCARPTNAASAPRGRAARRPRAPTACAR
jgi:cysteine-rich repeat protein